jgi:O-antigen/teichoic acid export membrane protein
MANSHYSNLYRLWKLFFLQSMVFVVVLVLAVVYFVKTSAIATQWGKYSLIAAGLSFLPSLPLLGRYREMFTASRGVLNEAASAAIRRLLMLGMMVADLPAIAGVVHYVMTGELAVMGGFCVVTCVIVYFYRPPQA